MTKGQIEILEIFYPYLTPLSELDLNFNFDCLMLRKQISRWHFRKNQNPMGKINSEKGKPNIRLRKVADGPSFQRAAVLKPQRLP